MISTKYRGDMAENYVSNYLEERNYRILQRNFRCKLGEIDIIAEKNGTIIIVEVKARWSIKYGLPQEAVDKRKLKKLYQLTDYYLKERHNLDKRTRIEVAAIEIKNGKIVSLIFIPID